LAFRAWQGYVGKHRSGKMFDMAATGAAPAERTDLGRLPRTPLSQGSSKR
jgi:hypothetical protein